MVSVKPVYTKLLIIALILFLIGVTAMLSDIYYKIGNIEHQLVHIKGAACPHKH